jgi:hypothetical protein
MATADSWYGDFGVRLTLGVGDVETEVLLTAENARQLVEVLTRWLATRATDDDNSA